MSKNLNDKELKDQGNKLFANRNYEAAIDCYTKAIMKNPSVPHYYTNRALCYLNQKRWSQAIQDSKYALERDPNLVKGHFYLGELKKKTRKHTRSNEEERALCQITYTLNHSFVFPM